ESAGCTPRTLEAEGLALANLGAVFDLPGVRLLADLGHRKTTFCLLADGHPVASRTVRIGGLPRPHALARARNLSLERAEQIKCGEGVLRQGAATGPQVGAVLERLAREVLLLRGSLEEVTARLGAIESVVLCGGTALLADLDGYLAERTGLST